jgi:hypothetical protein
MKCSFLKVGTDNELKARNSIKAKRVGREMRGKGKR